MPRSRPYVGQVTIAPRTPLRVRKVPESFAPDIAQSTKDLGHAAGLAIRAYYRELKRLREGPFTAAVERLPAHLTQPLRAYVICTGNVVFLREDLDPKLKQPKILVGSMTEPPEAAAPMLSEKTLYLLTGTEWAPDPNDGVQLQLSRNGEQPFWRMRVGVAGRMPESSDGEEPRPLVQMSRDVVTELYGHALGAQDEPTHEFLLRVNLNLPVGWQRVIAFAPSTKRQWTVAFGKALALRSVTTAVFNSTAVDAALNQFDPMRSARNAYTAIIDEFEQLIATADEAPVHQYLLDHPQLLFPCHSSIRSNVAFGNRVSDLVIRDSDGTYTLVELESPKRRLFTQAGDPTADLSHAINQVTAWRRYIEDNLRTVQSELALAGITPAARGLVVIGRSAGLCESTQRTLRVMAAESPGRDILTYDDVVARARATCSNLFGPGFKESSTFKAYVRPMPSVPAA